MARAWEERPANRPGILIPAVALLVALLSPAALNAQDWLPFEEVFGEFNACAVLLTRDRHHEDRIEYGAQQCALPQSPCSTFKIPNALIGLQEGVVSGPDHAKAWDGVVRDREETNRDQTLASAISLSVVWYFQSLARDVGAPAMQAWLDRLGYGNRDISGGIDQFWLGNSLRIDAYQQLEFLKSLSHGTLPFKPAYQSQVWQMLEQPSKLPGTLHGKTGSCRGNEGEPDHGWFIGWIDWDTKNPAKPKTTWFVVNIRGAGAWGFKARPMALELLNHLKPGD